MLRRKKSKAHDAEDVGADETAAGGLGPMDVVPALASVLDDSAEDDEPDAPKKKKKSKLKKLVILAGLGGAVFFVTKKLKGGSNGAPVPPPAPAPTPTQPVDSATQETPAPEQTPSA